MSRPRKLLYYVIMIALVALMIELFCRAYYYQKLSPPRSFATAQLFKDLGDRFGSHKEEDLILRRLSRNQYLVRPELSAAENDTINRECIAANKAVYLPWVDFTFMDYRSKYVNVVDHRRQSQPDRSDPTDPNPLRIFFLGGSTTYGLDVTDAETIPSAVVNAYRRKYPGGRPIQVVNLGMPYYFSYQELIQLTDLLMRNDRPEMRNDRPDIVIMLDGLNDCFEASAAVARAPVFAPRFQDRIKPGDVEYLSQQLQQYYDLPGGASVDSACAMVANTYLDNIRHAHDLTALYHIPLYCFWQPVPYYNYGNRANDPICTHSEQPRYGKIFSRVAGSAAKIPYLTYLGDMLHDEKGLPFVDQLHYSPAFSRTIAEKMLSCIDFPTK
jgi:hypothetical protein